MLRGACALSLGILLARWLVPPLDALLALLGLASALLLLALRAGRRRELPTAAATIAAVVVAGMVLSVLRDDALFDSFSGLQLNDVDAVGRVVSGPVVREGPGRERVEYLLDLDSLIFRNSVARLHRRVLVRVEDTTAFDPALLPGPGNHVVLRCAFEVPQSDPPPGVFDRGSFLAARGATALVAVRDVADIAITGRDGRSWIERLTGDVREGVRRFAERHVRGEEGEIVRALVTGERDGIDPETNDAFRRTGTLHVLSVSGLHVGILALALFVVVSWWRNRWGQVLLFTALLVPYVVLTGAAPPVLRAGLMAVVFMIARAGARPAHPLNILGAAALLILVADPAALFDLGFQLSCASVAGIVMIVPALDHRMRRAAPRLWRQTWLRWTAQLLAMSCAAQLATLPIILSVYGTVSPVSPFANLLVVPLMNGALGAGMLGALATPLSDTLGSWFGAAAYLLVGLSRWIAVECASLWWAQVALPSLSTAGAVVLGLAIMLIVARRGWRLVPRAVMVLAATVLVFVAERFADPLAADLEERVLLLPWRGGTAAAVQSKGRFHLYVDGALDTVGAAALARRTGVSPGRPAQVVPVHSPLHGDGGRPLPGSLLALDVRSTLAVPHDHLIFSLESGRVPGPVTVAGAPLLLLPLRFPLDEPLLLVLRRGRWEAAGNG